MAKYDYYNDVLKGVKKPSAFLDLEIFTSNIKSIAKRAKGKNIRIASKSIRNLAAMKYIFAQSEVFNGIMYFMILMHSFENTTSPCIFQSNVVM